MRETTRNVSRLDPEKYCDRTIAQWFRNLGKTTPPLDSRPHTSPLHINQHSNGICPQWDITTKQVTPHRWSHASIPMSERGVHITNFLMKPHTATSAPYQTRADESPPATAAKETRRLQEVLQMTEEKAKEARMGNWWMMMHDEYGQSLVFGDLPTLNGGWVESSLKNLNSGLTDEWLTMNDGNVEEGQLTVTLVYLVCTV